MLIAVVADIWQLSTLGYFSCFQHIKVNFYIQLCYISLSLPIFVILFLSSPLSVSCHSYHATYTYLITFDKQI